MLHIMVKIVKMCNIIFYKFLMFLSVLLYYSYVFNGIYTNMLCKCKSGIKNVTHCYTLLQMLGKCVTFFSLTFCYFYYFFHNILILF
jgi:hypothetical protein